MHRPLESDGYAIVTRDTGEGCLLVQVVGLFANCTKALEKSVRPDLEPSAP